MDQQITAVIVNRKEFLLKKGGGYHLDLLILAVIITVCSIFGLPWFVAATVLSINHIQARAAHVQLTQIINKQLMFPEFTKKQHPNAHAHSAPPFDPFKN